jgi:HSP20 family molecular chaperone IbpA
MWAEACAMIERAEQMHRQFFQPGSAAAPAASWEPPIDVFESERDLLIVVALPGVDTQDIEISSEGAVLRVAGVRRLPAARWELSRSSLVNGCLLLNLTKQA